MYIYNLREFASANERHHDSSALGRWIPRPKTSQNSPKYTKIHQSSWILGIFGIGAFWGFWTMFFLLKKSILLTLCSKSNGKQNYVFQKMTLKNKNHYPKITPKPDLADLGLTKIRQIGPLGDFGLFFFIF